MESTNSESVDNPSIGAETYSEGGEPSLEAGLEHLELEDSGHSWANKRFDANKKLEEHVSTSDKYKHLVPPQYINGEKVLLEEIYRNLPLFIAEHIKLSRHASPTQTTIQQNATDDDDSTCYYIDCNYMLNIHIPDEMKKYFRIEEERREVSGVVLSNRWIFVPSYNRARPEIFDWSDKIVNLEESPRVFVVRPSEFNVYRDQIRSNPNWQVALISLPEERDGIGYARYWIQRIADHFELDRIWMIDDNVDWMRQYPGTEKDKWDFDDAFKEIEKFAETNNVVAVGPRRFNGLTLGKVSNKPFTYKPPSGMVLLNLQDIKNMRVHYRPQLHCLEDMIFGYECNKHGLRVCRMNRFLLRKKVA